MRCGYPDLRSPAPVLGQSEGKAEDGEALIHFSWERWEGSESQEASGSTSKTFKQIQTKKRVQVYLLGSPLLPCGTEVKAKLVEANGSEELTVEVAVAGG